MISKQKPPISDNLVEMRINKTVIQNGFSDSVGVVIANMFRYMRKHQMYGCCHAYSSVLYVALKELGLSVELCIGICKVEGSKPFDHSWIEVDGKVVDLAIYMPLTERICDYSGPIVFDSDLVTMKSSQVEYGIYTDLPFDNQTITVMNMPFVDYMSAYPYETEGLWGVLKSISQGVIRFDTDLIKQKYSNCKRSMRR